MKRFFVLVTVIVCAITCLAQKDVTKFMGFPVDGSESEMINNLKTKGFKLSKVYGTNVLTGRFNGNDVQVFISTENGKVDRIMVADANSISETDIKIRFNKLCRQFTDNDKYIALDDYSIPESEDISYEMTVNNKRYEAAFYQLPDGAEKSALDLETIINTLKYKSVWFMISKRGLSYYISMFYDNEYNRANGEDL